MLTIRPLTAVIGAEVTGVDLSIELPELVRDEIKSALLQWKVLFFRDQKLDHKSQIRFTRQFGRLTHGNPVLGADDQYPEIYPVVPGRHARRYDGEQILRPWSSWHSDMTAAINPPRASVLRGDIIPPAGGDTQFSNLVAVYESLSQPIKSLVNTLWAIHEYAPPPGTRATPAWEEMMSERGMATEHPLAQLIPETGERALMASPDFLQRLTNVTARESQFILDMLWERLVRPEFCVRFKWEAGSVAFWDNRIACHMAPTDLSFVKEARYLYRTTILGEIPASIDGQPSRRIQGEPLEALPDE